MKKITTRAASVLLLAMLVIMGMNVYILRYIDQGRSWALTFARLNTESTATASSSHTSTPIATITAATRRPASPTIT